MTLMKVFLEAKRRLPVQPKSKKPKPVADPPKPKPKPKKPIFKNPDFEERLAILIESGHHSPKEAKKLAIADMGGKKLADWKDQLERVPDQGSQLVQSAMAFVTSPVGAMAAYYGWSDVEAFGVFDGSSRAMLHRPDATGLVPGLAWSRFDSRLIDIDDEQATIKTGTGSILVHKKRAAGHKVAVPFWLLC